MRRASVDMRLPRSAPDLYAGTAELDKGIIEIDRGDLVVEIHPDGVGADDVADIDIVKFEPVHAVGVVAIGLKPHSISALNLDVINYHVLRAVDLDAVGWSVDTQVYDASLVDLVHRQNDAAA